MSEFKGTPGPWLAKDVNICDFDKAGLQLAFSNTANEERRAEGFSNARLIVTAPELLEACLRIQAQFRQAGIESVAGSLNPIENNAAQIDAVILKALGQ